MTPLDPPFTPITAALNCTPLSLSFPFSFCRVLIPLFQRPIVPLPRCNSSSFISPPFCIFGFLPTVHTDSAAFRSHFSVKPDPHSLPHTPLPLIWVNQGPLHQSSFFCFFTLMFRKIPPPRFVSGCSRSFLLFIFPLLFSCFGFPLSTVDSLLPPDYVISLFPSSLLFFSPLVSPPFPFPPPSLSFFFPFGTPASSPMGTGTVVCPPPP